MWLATPFRKAAFMMSNRSRRPSRLAWAGPENGVSAETAMSTVWWCEPPTATPTQFRSVRTPSRRTGAGRSSYFARQMYWASVRVTPLPAASSDPAALGGTGSAACAAPPADVAAMTKGALAEASRSERRSIVAMGFLQYRFWVDYVGPMLPGFRRQRNGHRVAGHSLRLRIGFSSPTHLHFGPGRTFLPSAGPALSRLCRIGSFDQPGQEARDAAPDPFSRPRHNSPRPFDPRQPCCRPVGAWPDGGTLRDPEPRSRRGGNEHGPGPEQQRRRRRLRQPQRRLRL